MITLTDAAPDDAAAIARLLAELDTFYGDTMRGTQGERAAQVRAALFADPPAARALLAWDGPALAGFASWSLLWPAAGLTMSLYLKELYVAQAYRRAGTGKLLMEGLRRIAADRDAPASSGPPTRPTPQRSSSTNRSASSRFRPRSSTACQPAGPDT